MNNYWKSLEEKENQELGRTPEEKALIEREFMSSPFASEDGTSGVARRDFLKLMGASLALASSACVRRPVDYIVPYAEHPPELTPGVPNYYASSWVHQGEAYGLVVKTREGRPIKVEGNKNHPVNKKGLPAHGHSQILSLYDPDRIKNPLKRNEDGSFSKISWDDLDETVSGEFKKGEVAFLTSSLASPTTNQIIQDFLQGFKGRHVQWDVLGADDVVEGQKASYGTAVVPRYRFDQANMIVSIDADFLGTWLNPSEYSGGFAANRKPGQNMNKLVSFESMLSLTGMNADTRIQIAPSQQLTVVMGLLNELLNVQKVSRYANDSGVARVLSQFENAAVEIGIERELLAQVAKDLWANKGKSLVVAGGITTRTSQATDLQVAVNFLNTVLENDGKTIDGVNVTQTSFAGSYKALQALIADMNAGKIHTLILHKINPVYSLPKDSGFVEALKNVKMVLHTGTHMDESAKLAHYIVPDHHHLENWGDNEVQKGLFAIQQPTIRPMYDTRSLELSLISWAYQQDVGPSRLRDPDTWLQYLRESWKARKAQLGIGGDFDSFWTNFLKEGVVDIAARSGKRTATSVARQFLLPSFTNIKRQKTDAAVELQLYAKIGHQDGSFANIAWLQEFPDPVTKIVWDNYANISPQMAKTLGVKEGQVVEVTAGNKTIKLPAHIQPGIHPKVVAIAVGFGREDAGSVGTGVGKNAYELVTFGAQPVFSGIPVSLNVTKEKIELANVQGHHSMEGRQIVVQATLKDYLKDPGANIHRHKMLSLWGKHEYKGYRWAMVIDQSLCNGCSACVIACQSENNVPVVGKKYVLQGREMHWLRIDRYYVGGEDNPESVFQPMLCQHCENAPCETVCPVLATTHSDEGLNQMTYNRCVGTRYCSNNCPYKVRRFNWFSYSQVSKPQSLALNPDVTVRSRGVMEKCTFCTQRIHEAKGIAKDRGTVVKDGDIETACQAACSAGAIIFGNVNDPDSQVAKEFKNPRSYSVLEELNAVPMIQYQTKVRNADSVQPNGKGGH